MSACPEFYLEGHLLDTETLMALAIELKAHVSAPLSEHARTPIGLQQLNLRITWGS
jgi:hypothetical protein